MQIVRTILSGLVTGVKNFSSFSLFMYTYAKMHIGNLIFFLEQEKNIVVRFFMMKRGRYNRPFLHIATMTLLGMGVMIAPILADTFPVFGSQAAVNHLPSPSTQDQSLTADQNVFSTNISQKPRDSVITYVVERGDTLSTVAQKFGISVDTIKWANDLSADDVNIGDELKILPVTGVAYKVQSGDTVYTIAKKFDTDAQKIVDFPFNDFANPETFSLVEGEQLIVPDGVQPSARPSYVTQRAVLVQAPEFTNVTGDGFHWPVQGLITQGFTWYHNGIDIAGPVGTPIYASKAGVVMEANCGYDGGYACHVLLSHAGGWSTMYAHMVQQPSVSVGQSVSAGQLIGYRGNTGRSTGPHTHFEIRSPNGNLNPLQFLQ